MEPNKVIIEFTEREARDTIQAYEVAIKASQSSLLAAQVFLPLATKVQLAFDAATKPESLRVESGRLRDS